MVHLRSIPGGRREEADTVWPRPSPTSLSFSHQLQSYLRIKGQKKKTLRINVQTKSQTTRQLPAEPQISSERHAAERKYRCTL